MGPAAGAGDMQPPGPGPCNPPAAAAGPRDPRPGRPRAFAATSPRRGEAQPDPDPGPARPRGESTRAPAALRGFPGAGKGGWEAAGAPFSWGSRAPAGCSLCCRLERFCHLVINTSCQEITNFLLKSLSQTDAWARAVMRALGFSHPSLLHGWQVAHQYLNAFQTLLLSKISRSLPDCSKSVMLP